MPQVPGLVNSNLNHGKIIAVAGNQATAADVVEALQRAGYRIDFWLNVGPEHAEGIADYHDFEAEARRRDIRLLRPPTYAMRDEASRALFENARIDLLISVGWQRLFPRWFLERLSIGAFGMHGSAEPLPRGRGRSPMVWSILENRDRFFTNLFRYDEGVDSGEIVATQRFDVLASDTIQTLQHKNALAQIQLLEKHLPALLRGDAPLRPQPADLEPTYYPKRIPEDGVVDWSDSACRIDRLVRAVTRPYPGAFTFAEGKKIMIWEGSPFDRHLKLSAAPGEIAAAFHDGTFLVQCGDFAYWIKTWEGPAGWRPQKGDRFESRPNPSWKKLESMRVAGGSEPPFTFEGYGQLLEALKSGGYRSTLFQEDDGAEGRVLLRHDIDKDPIAALRLAEAEAGAGFRASYFFLLRCPLYSVLEPEGVEPIRAIAGLGHSVGLHCDEWRMLRGQLCDR
ncbi:MAG: hypothetical protein JO317_03940, partial [Verrucomicrobiae bacterium]|nr:hypothetical protein [Verrucomicrobiae bacterium]